MQVSKKSLTPSPPPPLKWAGGKRWLIPHLLPIWKPHQHCRLVEPFCGGLAVSLGLNPERALLNDINPHAINFYRQLKNGLRIRIQMQNEKESYYLRRNQLNRLIENDGPDGRRAAALFYYLNRTGYNGLCRFNRSGLFNVPYGKYRKINYRQSFFRYRTVFEKWRFHLGDFEKTPLQKRDFIYADPPYDVEFTQYSKEPFGWAEQKRLAIWLAAHPGPVVLSNQATPRILKLYKRLGFELQLLDAPRRISCTGDRRPAREVLALKNITTG